MSKRIFLIFMLALVAAVAVFSFLAVTGNASNKGKPEWQSQNEVIGDSIAVNTMNAVPFPSAEMKDSLERRNLRERLLRFNKPQKIGYLYVMSFGKFVGYYVVKGKISSVQSQMTSPVQTYENYCNGCTFAIESVGDDGSFGPNEGGDKGIFFFTSSGVLVETTLDWIYSDAPLAIKVDNLLKK